MLLCICNAADHWAGNHSKCAEIDSSRRCVKDGRGRDQTYYVEGGETHVAVKQWLQKKCTVAKMKHYTRARESFLSEIFHSVINKYASKRIHYAKSHKARIAAAACDWSESMEREVLARKQRKAAGTTIRKRAAHKNVLAPRTNAGKKDVYAKIFGK
jgi:hypothetical protein